MAVDTPKLSNIVIGITRLTSSKKSQPALYYNHKNLSINPKKIQTLRVKLIVIFRLNTTRRATTPCKNFQVSQTCRDTLKETFPNFPTYLPTHTLEHNINPHSFSLIPSLAMLPYTSYVTYKAPKKN